MKNLDSVFAAYIIGWGVFFLSTSPSPSAPPTCAPKSSA